MVKEVYTARNACPVQGNKELIRTFSQAAIHSFDAPQLAWLLWSLPDRMGADGNPPPLSPSPDGLNFWFGRLLKPSWCFVDMKHTSQQWNETIDCTPCSAPSNTLARALTDVNIKLPSLTLPRILLQSPTNLFMNSIYPHSVRFLTHTHTHTWMWRTMYAHNHAGSTPAGRRRPHAPELDCPAAWSHWGRAGVHAHWVASSHSPAAQQG